MTAAIWIGAVALGVDTASNMNPIVLVIALFGMAVQTVGVLGIVRRDGESRGEMKTTMDNMVQEVGLLRTGRDQDREAREHLAELISQTAIQVSRLTVQVDSLVGRVEHLERT